MSNVKMLFSAVKFSNSLIYKSSKLLILPYLFLSFLCATIPLVSTYIMKQLLDMLTASSPDVGAVMFYIVLYIAALVLLQGMNSSKAIVENSVITKAQHQYDCNVSEKLAALPMSVIDTSEGKNMIEDVRYSRNMAYLSLHFIYMASWLYSFIVAFSVLVTFNIWFSLLFLLLTVPGIIMNVVFSRKAEELRLKTAPDVRKFCYYRWMLTDAWPAKDVRMYDLTEPIKARYDAEKDEYRKANKKLDQKKTAALITAETIMRSGEIAFTVFVILGALAGEVSIGNIALYIGLALSAFTSFQKMFNSFVVTFKRDTKRMKRIFAFFSLECQNAASGTRKLKEFRSLVFQNVYFKYPTSNQYVLSGVSFTLNRGDKLALVGINGSGKSTIIKLMLGLYEIESGQILINDFPMSDYDIRDVRRLFSVLFQNFVQYPQTLRDNIALSDYCRAENDTEIVKALKQSGVYEELQTKLANGLDSYMTRQFDDQGTELSKGQWQKVALSRAYFKNAPIVIFDEPSAALDAEAEDRIFKNFESISDNRTGIMISHRISAARMSNKIIVLDGGKIVENGAHDELVALDGLYAKLYNLQREKYAMKEAE